MNEAIEFAQAIIDVERECPRGYNASAHITEYAHMMLSPSHEQFYCMSAKCPLEYRELFSVATKAQFLFWDKRHLFLQP